MKPIFFLLLIFCGSAAFAQIQVGASESVTISRYGKSSIEELTDAQINELKKTTTLFVLERRDYENIQAWDDAIRYAWKITPYKIIKDEEIEQYIKQPNYSFFSFGGSTVKTEQGVYIGDTYSSHMRLATHELWMPHKKEDGSIKGKNYFARIYLTPDIETWWRIHDKAKKFEDIIPPISYVDARYFNWLPGIMSCYWKTINDLLEKKESRVPLDEGVNQKSLKKLGTDTLYIAEYAFKLFYANPAGKKFAEAEAIMKENYAYPVRVIGMNELETIISSRERSIRFLLFNTYWTTGIINIFESLSGRAIYSTVMPAENKQAKEAYSAFISPREFKMLSKDVKRAQSAD